MLQQREIIPVGGTEALPIDTRLIAATNRDLEEEMKRGGFRSDLFYRLNVFALHLPPLRQRRDDIPLLIDAFLARGAEQRGDAVKRLSADALEAMLSYDWPGNVRELENALERAAILTKNEVIDLSVLPVARHRAARRAARRRPRARPRIPTLEVIEKAYILWVLQSEGGNKSRAAEALGIDPSTLYRKLSRYGVDV